MLLNIRKCGEQGLPQLLAQCVQRRSASECRAVRRGHSQVDLVNAPAARRKTLDVFATLRAVLARAFWALDLARDRRGGRRRDRRGRAAAATRRRGLGHCGAFETPADARHARQLRHRNNHGTLIHRRSACFSPFGICCLSSRRQLGQKKPAQRPIFISYYTVAAWPRGRVAAWPRGRVAAWPVISGN